MPDVAAIQVLTLLHQGNVAEAAEVAETHDLPLSQARAYLVQGDPSDALAVLEPVRRQAEAKNWPDERLKTMVLQALAYQARDDKETAVQLLTDALALAKPGGFIRLFIDEGAPMARLLTRIDNQRPKDKDGDLKAYIRKLLAVFAEQTDIHLPFFNAQPLVEPLSERQLEVLQLIAQGLSNREIGERLFIALDTVKGHNRRIYGKLQVQNRTEAAARARELGLL